MSDTHDQAQTPDASRRRYTKLAAASAVTAVAGAGVLLFAFGSTSASAAPQDKVTICHARSSVTNPYGPKAITVSENSILKPNGHATHTGPIFDPNGGKNQPQWGDIIPPFDYNGGSFPGLNWTSEGMAILNNNCQIPTEPTDTTTVTATVTDTSTVTNTSTVTATESSSAGTEPTSTSNPPVVTVTQTAGAAPTEVGQIPAAVAAGQHTTVSSEDAALGGILMAVGVGGLLTAVRPWKRGSH